MELSTLTRPQGANRTLITGETSSPEFTLAFADEPVLVKGFRKMVRDLEFDVAEMAITTYLTAKEHGVAFTALPIFLVRDFHHGATQVLRQNAGRPASDFTGARIGVNRGYTVTTGVWGRAALVDAGLDLDSVNWVRSGDEHVASYMPPQNVTTIRDGSTLEGLLLGGELDAVVGADISHPDVVPLFENPDEAAAEQVQERGIFPINHLLVVRNDLVAQYPKLAAALFTDFSESKRLYVERLRGGLASTRQDHVLRRVMEITGEDPLPYGVENNRATLEALIENALSQHIIRSRPQFDDLFAQATLELAG